MNRSNLLFTVLIAVILAFGTYLRLQPTDVAGFDENIYHRYLQRIQMDGGLGNYREIVNYYETGQEKAQDAIVHPLRLVFLMVSYVWMGVFHVAPLEALHEVSAVAGILHLFVAGIFAWRAGGRGVLPGVLALVACAPLQICLAQRALIDGMYAMEAMLCFWLLWENLRAPADWRWLAAYTFSLFVFVLTKEYSAFVVFGFCCLMAVNRWLHFGRVTPWLLAATAAGPALAVLVLAYYAGGFPALVHFYHIFILKSQTLNYAIYMQSGPWSRYLLDFMLVTPVVLLLAIGRLFQVSIKDRADLFCALFILFTYIPMASVSGGMSLRFAAFWDLPLCWLAFSQLRAIAGKFSPQRPVENAPDGAIAGKLLMDRHLLILAVTTTLLCGIELQQFHRIFSDAVQPPVFDPVTLHLLRAVKIVKFTSPVP